MIFISICQNNKNDGTSTPNLKSVKKIISVFASNLLEKNYNWLVKVFEDNLIHGQLDQYEV